MVKLIQLTIAILLTFIVTTTSSQAHSHNRSQSFSDWEITDNIATAVFTAKSREITRLQSQSNQSLDTLLVDHLISAISVSQDSLPCSSTEVVRPIPSALGYVRVRLVFDCGASLGDISISINSFFNVASSHVHYANMSLNREPSYQYLFTNKQRRHEITNQLATSSHWFDSITQFVLIGIEHIFGGIDHIAFLLALLLLLRSLKVLVWMVTGFTLGHSITLALAALGWVIPDLDIVEAAIGFTIALVAVQNIAVLTGNHRQITYFSVAGLLLIVLINLIWNIGLSALSGLGLALFTLAYLWNSADEHLSANLRLVTSVIFGLIHGFGFASALTETGLASTQLLPALLGFNLGIELGQIVIIAVVWALLQQIRQSRFLTDTRLVIDLVSAALCGLGLYWFIGRSYGII
ncbi:HupE/UreJ family protein [Porticoccaceae bacterium]|nr:HupE/UreJ family protein [Porticoccaceae bacterium]